MRKYFSLLALLPLFISTFIAADGRINCCGCTSKTFFSTRPQYQSATPEKNSFLWDRMTIREDGHGGVVQFALFGGRSTDRCNLATYFTPCFKRCLTVKEFDDGKGSADLIGQHFNILTENGQETLATDPCNKGSFHSCISFCPRLTTFGLGVTYRQSITNLWSDYEDRTYDVWFEVSTSITRVETTLGFSERIINDGGGAYKLDPVNPDYNFYANMAEAFNQKAWRYGKIFIGQLRRWRLADIDIKLGVQLERERYLFDAYIGAILPAGNRPCGEYLFEPLVGHHKHAGISIGAYIDVRLWENESMTRKFSFGLYGHGQYLFSACECRSFDLCCKPWSRYMQVYTSKDQAIAASHIADTTLRSMFATPGINVFTQCVNVCPRGSFSLLNPWTYTGKLWDLSFGYNLYVRQAECLSLYNWCYNELVLKDCIGRGVANKYRTICKNNREKVTPLVTFNETNFNESIIQPCDLNLSSATHPRVISHTFFLATARRWDDREYPLIIDFGGSYEFGKENYVLHRWTFWTKLAFSF